MTGSIPRPNRRLRKLPSPQKTLDDAPQSPSCDGVGREWIRDKVPRGSPRQKADRDKLGAELRPLIEDLDTVAWKHPQTGMPITWAERPRLFRLALGHRDSGKSPNARAGLILAAMQQLAPHPRETGGSRVRTTASNGRPEAIADLVAAAVPSDVQGWKPGERERWLAGSEERHRAEMARKAEMAAGAR